MSALAWELQWIDDNVERYDSPMHAQAVKGNIEKRYRINQLERDLSAAIEAAKPDYNSIEGYAKLTVREQAIVQRFVEHSGLYELLKIRDRFVGAYDIFEDSALGMMLQRGELNL